MAKRKQWVYGQSPNPKTWAEAAGVLKGMQAPKKKPNVLLERLSTIEKMLKDK